MFPGQCNVTFPACKNKSKQHNNDFFQVWFNLLNGTLHQRREGEKRSWRGNSYNFTFWLQFPETEKGWKRYPLQQLTAPFLHLALNRGGRWGTTDDFTTSFLHFLLLFLFCFPLPSGAWRSPGLSTPWCCLPTPSSVCLVFFPLSLCLARWFWPGLQFTHTQKDVKSECKKHKTTCESFIKTFSRPSCLASFCCYKDDASCFVSFTSLFHSHLHVYQHEVLTHTSDDFWALPLSLWM